jgi:hypothetical protein
MAELLVELADLVFERLVFGILAQGGFEWQQLAGFDQAQLATARAVMEAEGIEEQQAAENERKHPGDQRDARAGLRPRIS